MIDDYVVALQKAVGDMIIVRYYQDPAACLNNYQLLRIIENAAANIPDCPDEAVEIVRKRYNV